MKEKKDKKIHKTSIGGQAVIEGVMMKGPKEMAIAVRKPDGEIIIEKKPVSEKIRKSKILKWTLIRGCVGFFDSMVTGVKALMFSAQFFDVEGEEESESKFDKWLERKFGDKVKDIVIYVSVVLSLIFSIGLFFLLPNFITELIAKISGMPVDGTVRTLIEGGVRMLIFLGYILLVSQMKDIKRVFMYHGAEHKTIATYEHGMELTVENVRKGCRLHPRCGTSFLIFVMIVSVIVFLIIPKGLPWYLRAVFKILLLPLVAGISYEIIKFAGRHENWFTKIISMPGMWLQYITTREPDDSQLEVAIASLKAVIPDNKEEDKW
ncbi:MAG: DUF1385 domain-containing protein [Clostridia bacterium]|nr:DUF1385 domain-containing protein [Clostridia bacterium]